MAQEQEKMGRKCDGEEYDAEDSDCERRRVSNHIVNMMSSSSRSCRTIPIYDDCSTRLGHWIREVRINISLHNPRFCHVGCWGYSLSSIRGGCIRIGLKHTCSCKSDRRTTSTSEQELYAQSYISNTYTEVVRFKGVSSIILRVYVRARYAHCCFKPSLEA